MIGWASAPYNFEWALSNPKSAAKMSLAGPSANLLLVAISAIIIRIGIAANIFVAPESVNYTHAVAAAQGGALSVVAAFLNVFFSLNLIRFLFNLLPIPPLDGSGILPLFMSEERASKYLEMLHHPSLSILGLLIAWTLFDFIYDPFHLICINVLYAGIAHYH